MPELPEIETTKRNIQGKIIGKKIISFKVIDLKILRGQSAIFDKKIKGSSFKSIQRHGQVLIFKIINGYYLFIYPQATGDLIYYPAEKLTDKHTLAVFEFKDNTKLFFNNKRRLGYFKLVNDNQRKRMLVHFGIDPLSKKFGFTQFIRIVKNKRTNIKNFLINQKYISGVGDIYADEICFEARINPCKPIKSLSSAEKKRLYAALRKILKKSLEYDGLNLVKSDKKIRYNHFLKVYKRQDMQCFRCKKGIIKKERIGYKWAYYCPCCQN